MEKFLKANETMVYCMEKAQCTKKDVPNSITLLEESPEFKPFRADWALSVRILHVLLVSAWVSSRCSDFL